jgi:hypothetical protein
MDPEPQPPNSLIIKIIDTRAGEVSILVITLLILFFLRVDHSDQFPVFLSQKTMKEHGLHDSGAQHGKMVPIRPRSSMLLIQDMHIYHFNFQNQLLKSVSFTRY